MFHIKKLILINLLDILLFWNKLWVYFIPSIFIYNHSKKIWSIL